MSRRVEPEALQEELRRWTESVDDYFLIALPKAASFVPDMRWRDTEGLSVPVEWTQRRSGEPYPTEFGVSPDAVGRFVPGWYIVMTADSSGATAPTGADEIAATSDPAETGDDGWGPVIPAAEAEDLERQNLRLQVEQRREQLASSFTRSEAAALLGVSPQTVSDMVTEHRLVGLKDGRAWKLPAWQFTPDLEEPVLPEIGRLAKEFPGGVVSLSRWMSRPNDNFTGRTPAQEMLHDSDRVFAVVRSLTAA